MHPLSAKIGALQRRLVVRRRVTAWCWIGATCLAAAMGLGLFDYLVRPTDVGLRIMATFALVGIMLWAMYLWWYLPSRRRLAPLAVARRVESRFPHLHDSLASAVEFLGQSESETAAGSAQLRRRVVIEASTAVDGIALDEVIDRRPLRRAVKWLAATLIALAVCVAWDARAVGTAAMRLAVPLGAAQWPRQHHLAFRTLPTRLVAGQPFQAEIIDTTGQLPEDVRVQYRFNVGGQRQSTSETPEREGKLAFARRDEVRDSFALRVVGGDDDTMRWHWVDVVEPPRLESLTMTVHPPAYTGLPQRVVERRVDVLSGSRIELHGCASSPLKAARILRPDAAPIDAAVIDGTTDAGRRQFHVPRARWVVATSGTYGLELVDADGVNGTAKEWRIQVQPDLPPTVTWRRPTEDLHVVPTAVVPLELAVEDDFAIQRVGIEYERSDPQESSNGAGARSAKIELFRGPPTPATFAQDGQGASGEKRRLEYVWDLASLQLPVGAQLVVHGEASDYRPGTGRTVAPRRIAIIGGEELERRLAERQYAIVGQLERALRAQHGIYDALRPLDPQQNAPDNVPNAGNALQLAELGQRRVAQLLVDPTDGVSARVAAALAEIEINSLTATPHRPLLERLSSDLQRLAAGPLDVAVRELVAASKAIADSRPDVAGTEDAGTAPAATRFEPLSPSIAAATSAQQEVISTVERWIHELTGRVDQTRLVQELIQLRQDQVAHKDSTQAEIGLETLPLQLNELTRAQRTHLESSAAGQEQIAGRFSAIVRQMEALATRSLDDGQEPAAAIISAVGLARQLDLEQAMRQTARELRENRVGRAFERQTQIAADLERLIDHFRGQAGLQPAAHAAELRDSQQRLDRLRREVAALRQQIAQSEREAEAADARQKSSQLAQQQESLQRELQQLSQKLEQLLAADAGQSVRQAADHLAPQSAGRIDGTQQSLQPAKSSDVQHAENDLEQAARELAQHLQQAEMDLALQLVQRLQAELAQMVERQQVVIARTAELEAALPPGDVTVRIDSQAVHAVVAEERALAELATEHAELLFGLTAVRVGLEEAQRRLAAAADRLATGELGAATQAAAKHALMLLEGTLQAFAQTASEAGQAAPPPAASPNGAAGAPPQRRPTFELLEVKMLRMMQAELHGRTREFQQKSAAASPAIDEREQAELEREARALQAEQNRLAKLVEQMLTRNNEQQ